MSACHSYRAGAEPSEAEQGVTSQKRRRPPRLDTPIFSLLRSAPPPRYRWVSRSRVNVLGTCCPLRLPLPAYVVQLPLCVQVCNTQLSSTVPFRTSLGPSSEPRFSWDAGASPTGALVQVVAGCWLPSPSPSRRVRLCAE